MSEQAGPIPHAYWVQPDRLLAGEYPGSRYSGDAGDRPRRLLDAGITFFLDLTQEHEYGIAQYAPLLPDKSDTRGLAIEHKRISIPDYGAPAPEDMVLILDTIDAALKAGHNVYVHCYAGIGRTGTVIGCYLVRHGLSGERALDRIASLRREMPNGRRHSPETDGQRNMVRNWTTNCDRS